VINRETLLRIGPVVSPDRVSYFSKSAFRGLSLAVSNKRTKVRGFHLDLSGFGLVHPEPAIASSSSGEVRLGSTHKADFFSPVTSFQSPTSDYYLP
jgi:hypothetical protein